MVVAHPGHELRLHGWLERAKPLLFVISDGSARSLSRIPSSRRVLDDVGGVAGSIFGRFTDAELYRAIIEGDVDGVAEATCELSEALVSGVEQVVCDAWEDYNPAHDLCRVMTSLAVGRARTASGRTIALYDYAVVGPAGATGASGEIVITLDDDALARKVAAARANEALKNDVDEQLRDGSERFRVECLRPAPVEIDRRQHATQPAYELFGEARVAEGRYSTVLRYREHFAPFVEALIAAVAFETAGKR
ncbi:MAG: hypothetical protein QOC81_4125 [Thermoanaerobaculia bacterium]|jgi:hypothetical protein|nr:hypothetical protein [Thermoanaerobaculia bacterium]